MKRWISMLLVTALLIGLFSVLPVTAANRAAVPVVKDAPFTEILTCDEWTPGVIGVNNSYGDAPTAVSGMSVVEQGGERGNAIEWTMLDSGAFWGQEMCVVFRQNGLTDWGAYKELWCYLDLSGSTKQSPDIHLGFNNGGGGWTDLKAGGSGYLYDAATRSEQTLTFSAWGTAILPKQFVGWLRVPMSQFTAFGDFGYNNVQRLAFSFGIQSGETALLDSFCVLSRDWTQTLGLPCDRHFDAPEPLPEQVTPVWDMESMPVDTYFGESGETTGIIDAHQSVGTTFRVSAMDKTGFSGSRALAWTTLDSAWKAPLYFNLEALSGTVRDWSGAQELWFWVNAKQWNKPSILDICFVDAQGTSWQTYRENCTDGTYYLQENGKWVARGLNSWGHISLQAQYVGWVRVTLDNGTFNAGNSAASMALNGVKKVGFYVETGCTESTVYIDNVGVGRNYTSEVNPVFNEALRENPTMRVYKNSTANILDCAAADASGDSLRYVVTGAALHGTATIGATSGKLVYRPAKDYSGTDSFTVTASNCSFGKTELTVSVTVSNETDPNAQAAEDLPAANPGWPEKPAAVELAQPVQERAEPTASDLGLSGYVADNVDGTIAQWLLTALEKNPNIIEQIANAGVSKTQLSAILLDYGNAVSSGAQSFAITTGKGFGRRNALQLKQLKDNVQIQDTCFALTGVGDAKVDWSGGTAWWIYVDASEYDTVGATIGLAFQENDASGPDAYGLKAGQPFYICEDGSTQWQTGTTITTAGSGANTGALMLPAGFTGWLRVPFSTLSNLYWAGGGNRTMELKNVVQLNLRLEATSGMNEKSVYYSAMGVSASGEAAALPVAVEGSAEGLRTVWSMDSMTSEQTGYDGALVAWYGEFVGKLLTGVAYCYESEPSEELKAAGDEIVSKLASAQAADGYLGIYSGAARMGGSGGNWDVWNHYHAIYGLLQWYQCTGNEQARDIARKATAFVYGYFEGSQMDINAAGNQTMNLAICHAFALMYQDTGKQEYLDAAVQIVDKEWPKSGNWMNEALAGVEFYQSSLPRWEAMHAISCLGTLYEITGEKKYFTALETIYWSIAKTDRHNTGGFTAGEQAVGDPYASGSIETCCAVAWMALGTEYLQLSKNSLAADELELTYFNNMLASLLDDCRTSTYDTPMNGYLVGFTRYMDFQWNEGSPDFNCCQANLARGVGSVSQWAVLTDSQAVYLNYYGASCIAAKTPAGNALTLRQQTQYPVNGEILLCVEGLAQTEEFTLNLRIPAWANGSKVVVDGQTLRPAAGGYLPLTRAWQNGDTVRLTLNVDFHYWVGENACNGKTAVYYGPVLLVLEKSTYGGIDSIDKIVLQTTDLLNAKVSDGADIGTWLRVDTLDVNDIPVCLTDLASVKESWLSGMDSAYVSWLNLRHRMNYMWFNKGGTPVWCNTDGCSHHALEQDPATAADCTHDGLSEGTRCAFCAQVLTAQQVNAPALGHDLIIDVAVAATCTEPGKTEGSHCSRCDYKVAQKTVNALGHDLITDAAVPATCTEPGKTEGCHCNRCDYTVAQETVNALGHDLITDAAVAATCTETGLTEGSHCSRCDYTVAQETVNVLGHSWDNGKVTTAPTTSAEGVRTYTCSRCGETKTEAIAKLTVTFTDVDSGSFYAKAVDWAVAGNITKGTGATTFSPEATCTRGQVVTFLWRAAGEPTPTKTENPFTDVKSGTSYYTAVLWAVENGITAGTSSTTFSPSDGCTRGQVVTFLWRFEKNPAPKSAANPFTDVTGTAFYYNAVLWAAENGITTGTGKTTFSPDTTCTRGQIVTFLWRDLAGK